MRNFQLMLALAFSIIVSASASPALAQQTVITDFYNDYIGSALDKTRAFDGNCIGCQLDNRFAGQSNSSPQCRQSYERFYENPTIDMRIVFGYTEGETDWVDGIDQAIALIGRVTAPCAPNRGGACGFRRDPDDAELFTKMVRAPDGRMREVKLRIVSSSVTRSDRLNRSPARAAEQLARTNHARSTFLSGLQEADLLIYAGHARDGGGPSFEPPRQIRGTNRTDLAHYRRTRDTAAASSTEMYANLALATRNAGRPRPPILGLLGCNTARHFGSKLRRASPGTGLLLTEGESFPETDVAQIASSLDSVLSMRCQPEFNRGVDGVREFDPVAPRVRLDGFLPSI